ncbi:Na-translocating system protein MpsC family protein [Patulibacter americanus]|uniref:Na-translocating system protein MpsC family protein n=1 Tax=Patulibacter americanus TaxID=588672 RepID=UPI0003B43779|nr:Na-translocating system protein MpsC family protein [Patulibacter americanus]
MSEASSSPLPLREPAPEPAEAGRTSSPLLEISNAIVALHKRHYGKGPTSAKTYMVGELVVVLLKGGYTQVERTLYLEGLSEAVMVQRRAFQDAMQDRFRHVVEEATGREVVAVMSSNHLEPDLSCETFVLGDDAAADPTA